MKPKLGQFINIDILRLGINGEGIGTLDGFTIFVPWALPEEKVLAEMILVHKTYGKARLHKIISFSKKKRLEPACSLFTKCGGCQLMHLPYQDQLTYKTARIADNIQRLGGINDVHIKPCIAAEKELYYRNKIEVPFGLALDKPDFGFYESESHNIIPFNDCPVHCGLGREVFTIIKNVVLESGIPPYNEAKHNQGLRHVLVKTAESTGEVLVVLVTNGFAVKGIEKLGENLIKCHKAIKGVVQNNNEMTGNIILGRNCRTLAGMNSISEKIFGLTFNIDALSFFQINTGQTKKLIETVIALACLTGKEELLDIFCGVGLFSLCLSGKVRKVTGIESVENAVNLARFNAGINNIKNTEFLCGNAETAISNITSANVVILDPPRKGCDPCVLSAINKISPSRIVYVSCNPSTLARDLKILAQYGYKVDAVQPIDMFPQTSHVETVAGLKRHDL